MSSSCIKNPLAQRLCPACQKPSTLRVPPSSPCSSDFNQLPGVNACHWLLLHVIASLCHATDPTDDANHKLLEELERIVKNWKKNEKNWKEL